MQRGRNYPQSLDFWSEPDCNPVLRRPLELLTIQWRFSPLLFSVTIDNSTGIFDPDTGTYVWLDSGSDGFSAYVSTIVESIDHAGGGNRFDFDIENVTIPQHYHGHLFTREQGYIWAVHGMAVDPLHVDADTFVGNQSVIIAMVPRRYF